MIDALPAVNAGLNTTSAILLLLGWRAIRTGRERRHRGCMLAAAGVSTLFLLSYLTRYALTGSHLFPGVGWLRAIYLAILYSHMLLAIALLPLVLRTLFLALRGRRADHRRIARYTLPIWIYVSVTGVAVYLLLYQIAGAA